MVHAVVMFVMAPDVCCVKFLVFLVVMCHAIVTVVPGCQLCSGVVMSGCHGVVRTIVLEVLWFQGCHGGEGAMVLVMLWVFAMVLVWFCAVFLVVRWCR